MLDTRAWLTSLSQRTPSLFRWMQLSFAVNYSQTPGNRGGKIMKMLMYVSIPHHQFNAAVKEGSVGAKLNRILEAIKPEAAYFTEHEGKRGAVLVVDLPDASKIPALAEPWFLTFEADVEFRPVMTADDLKKGGLDELGKKWS
jgi:hypothetical protein